MVTAIVLAAGLSTRMKQANKLFLPLDGKPMVKHAIDSLRESDIDEIIIVSSELTHETLKSYNFSDTQLVQNHDYRSGMTSSIQTGVAAANLASHFMICLGDMPHIKTATYDTLIGAADHNKIVIPSYNQVIGNPVIFASDFRNEILQHNESEGCKGIVATHKGMIDKLKVNDPGILSDIDTDDDYRKMIASTS